MRMCSRCVMDESDAEIKFSESGCNHCDTAARKLNLMTSFSDSNLQNLMAQILSMQRNGHLFLIGLSGGLDSSYLLLRLVEFGIKPVVFHVDAGWNRPQAVKNVYNLANNFNLELRTRVINWKTIADLQLAFLRSGVMNQDVPQDHAFASALYSEIRKLKFQNILSGWNIQSESILPSSWSDHPMDKKILKKISKTYGNRDLAGYPMLNYFQLYFSNPYVHKIKTWKPLSYMDYHRERAKSELMSLGWEDYGAKHEESVFTKYFQGYYLPKRFGIDKRRAHFSSLIVSNQITRLDALQALKQEPIPAEEILYLREYISFKLNISIGELERYERLPRNEIRTGLTRNLGKKTFKWLLSSK